MFIPNPTFKFLYLGCWGGVGSDTEKVASMQALLADNFCKNCGLFVETMIIWQLLPINCHKSSKISNVLEKIQFRSVLYDREIREFVDIFQSWKFACGQKLAFSVSGLPLKREGKRKATHQTHQAEVVRSTYITLEKWSSFLVAEQFNTRRCVCVCLCVCVTVCPLFFFV